MIKEFDYEIEGLPLIIKVQGYTGGFSSGHEMIFFDVYVKGDPDFELDFRIFHYWEEELREFAFYEMREYYKDMNFENEIEKMNMEDCNGRIQE